jgi:hypothetical protein
MALLSMCVLLTAKNDTPQQTENRFLHLYGNHSYAKAPNSYNGHNELLIHYYNTIPHIKL